MQAVSQSGVHACCFRWIIFLPRECLVLFWVAVRSISENLKPQYTTGKSFTRDLSLYSDVKYVRKTLVERMMPRNTLKGTTISAFSHGINRIVCLFILVEPLCQGRPFHILRSHRLSKYQGQLREMRLQLNVSGSPKRPNIPHCMP